MTEYRSPRFEFLLADGRVVTGVVHGCGGVLSRPGDLERLQLSIERAKEGDPLAVYEPRPGHVRVYPHYSAYHQGDHIDVGLRGATVSLAKEQEQ